MLVFSNLQIFWYFFKLVTQVTLHKYYGSLPHLCFEDISGSLCNFSKLGLLLSNFPEEINHRKVATELFTLLNLFFFRPDPILVFTTGKSHNDLSCCVLFFCFTRYHSWYAIQENLGSTLSLLPPPPPPPQE